MVTRNILLAARVMGWGGLAVSPRGARFIPDDMAERRSLRNSLDELRGAGMQAAACELDGCSRRAAGTA